MRRHRKERDMEGRTNTGLVRLAMVILAALTLVLVAAMTAPTRADAHEQAGRTLIYVDGDLAKNTRDDHFAFRRTLSPGCHNVRVVQSRGGNVVGVYEQRECSRGRSVLEVKVDHSSVEITTTSKAIVYENDMAR